MVFMVAYIVLVSLTRCLGRGTIVSSRWGYELVSLIHREGGIAGWNPGPVQLVVWGPKSVQSAEFPGQVRPLVLLHRRRKP